MRPVSEEGVEHVYNFKAEANLKYVSEMCEIVVLTLLKHVWLTMRENFSLDGNN